MRFLEKVDMILEAGADKMAAQELKLYIDNDHSLYNQRFIPIMKNLSKKMAKGQFDERKAVKAFMYLVDDGAKKYVKDYDDPNSKIQDVFNKATRELVAKEYVEDFKDAWKNKEYSWMSEEVKNDIDFLLKEISGPGVKNAPKPKFKLGDRVRRKDDKKTTGKIRYIGNYDEYIKQYRYRVKQDDGAYIYWNANSMEKY